MRNANNTPTMPIIPKAAVTWSARNRIGIEIQSDGVTGNDPKREQVAVDYRAGNATADDLLNAFLPLIKHTVDIVLLRAPGACREDLIQDGIVVLLEMASVDESKIPLAKRLVANLGYRLKASVFGEIGVKIDHNWLRVQNRTKYCPRSQSAIVEEIIRQRHRLYVNGGNQLPEDAIQDIADDFANGDVNSVRRADQTARNLSVSLDDPAAAELEGLTDATWMSDVEGRIELQQRRQLLNSKIKPRMAPLHRALLDMQMGGPAPAAALLGGRCDAWKNLEAEKARNGAAALVWAHDLTTICPSIPNPGLNERKQPAPQELKKRIKSRASLRRLHRKTLTKLRSIAENLSDPKAATRASVILMLAAGLSTKQVSAECGLSKQSIVLYARRFLDGGIGSLATSLRGGVNLDITGQQGRLATLASASTKDPIGAWKAAIILDLANGMTYPDAAEKYGRSQDQIHRIVRSFMAGDI